jgi:ribosomal protein S18 acetylase RimI-like enzyme
MKITILTVGSRGDIQPFVALGLGLQQAGHHVTVCTSHNFQAFVEGEINDNIVGMALCYIRYSTWKGPVLYLEDLIVSEAFRGQGMGKALFETCLAYAREKEYAHMTWQVLDWNQDAIDFYDKYGATFDGTWVNCSISSPSNESIH